MPGWIATLLVVPPVNLILLVLAGLAIGRRAGRVLAAAAALLLLLLALPVCSRLLTASLERGLERPDVTGGEQEATVVLGGDTQPATGQPGLAVGALTLERERAAAALYRDTRLPVLLSGGIASDRGPAVAVLMRESLDHDFGVPARWIEARSRTTWDNAVLSAAMLRRDGIGAVYVVTQAWHMRRALIAFRAAGMTALAAPTLRDAPPDGGVEEFLPSATALRQSYFALHEWIGGAWYALRATHG